MELRIYPTDTGFKCDYRAHSWSKVELKPVTGGYEIFYVAYDPQTTGRHGPVSNLEGTVLDTDRRFALSQALEVIKKNLEGIFASDVNFEIVPGGN